MNLKMLLMVLGNTLVGEHGYTPSGCFAEDESTTQPITDFTEWLNNNPQAQEVLHNQGIEWPI